MPRRRWEDDLRFDVIIIGGGIVGLATAMRIHESNPDLDLLLLEKEYELAHHQTGNNSGVIHSGLYYKPGSLKALNCIRGYDLLVAFCRKNEIPFEICGKIVVATSEEELPLLDALRTRGEQNGLTGLKPLTAEGIKEYEPHVTGCAGLLVPQTGIVDYKRVAEKYAERLRAAGAEVKTRHEVVGIRERGDGVEVTTLQRTFSAKLVINCAGLQSDRIARMAGALPNVAIVPFRGEYYALSREKEHLVNNLVYPVPNPAFPFLGVHFTRMMRGGVEAGPNAVLAFKREGYKNTDVDFADLIETLAWPGFRTIARKYWHTGLSELYRSFSKAAFTRALQKLIPAIEERDLVEGGAGVRAQACSRDGGLIDDFLILEEAHAINVCNAPSPAATSSLAIGESIAALAMRRF